MKRLSTPRHLVSAVVVAVAAFGTLDASAASAAGYCVNDPACVLAGGVAKTTVQGALDAAANGVNTVHIGPGTYVGSDVAPPNAYGFTYDAAPNSRVAIIGAGAGQTILSPVPGLATTNSTTLDLDGGSSTVSNLTVMRGTASSTANAIRITDASADHVVVSDLPGATYGSGINVGGGLASITDCSIVLGPFAAGVFAAGGAADVSVDRCTLTGSYGAYTNAATKLKVVRSTLASLKYGALYGYGAMTAQADVLRLATDGPAAITALAGSSPASSASVAAKGVTIVGPAGSVGVLADATGGTGATTAHVTLDSSIVRGPSLSAKTVQSPGAASIVLTYSDVQASSGTGIVFGAGNLGDIDPQFVDAAADDFHIAAGSPLIDTGNPAPLLLGDSLQDLDLGPRVVHGRSDMGAYEYDFKVPVVVATATPAAAVTGQAISFDGSGSSDPDPGDALTYAWSFDDGTTASGAVVTHAFATARPHVETLTVTDPTALAATTTVTVQISVAPPSDDPKPKPAAFAGVSFLSKNVHVTSTGRVTVPLYCPASSPGDCSGSLTMTAHLPRRSKTKTSHASTGAITIGKVKFAIRKGTSKTVSVALTTVARGVIARTHRLSSSAVTVARAGDGHLVSRNTTLTITPAPKPKAKKHHH